MQPAPYTFTPSRRTQPYRDTGSRAPGAALAAMLNGSTLYGQNPMDQQRQFQAGQVKPGSLWWHILNLSRTAGTVPNDG